MAREEVAYHVQRASLCRHASCCVGRSSPIVVRSCRCSVKVSWAIKNRCCLPWRSSLPSLFMRPTRDNLAKGFHDLLDAMNIIGHNLGVGQVQLHRQTIARTHIHTHRFHPIRLIKVFQQLDHLVLGSSFAHFNQRARLQITENGVIAMAFAPGKLVNAQKTRQRKFSVSLADRPALISCSCPPVVKQSWTKRIPAWAS